MILVAAYTPDNKDDWEAIPLRTWAKMAGNMELIAKHFQIVECKLPNISTIKAPILAVKSVTLLKSWPAN